MKLADGCGLMSARQGLVLPFFSSMGSMASLVVTCPTVSRSRKERIPLQCSGGPFGGQASVRLLEDEHPMEALALDELASSSIEQVAFGLRRHQSLQ
jgi:hypothetical protein